MKAKSKSKKKLTTIEELREIREKLSEQYFGKTDKLLADLKKLSK